MRFPDIRAAVLTPILAATLLLTACSAEQLAGSFQSWCGSAPNCTDRTKEPR
jgi:hypothetical protein